MAMRFLIALFVAIFLIVAIPALCSLIGFALPPAAWTLIRACIFLAAILYALTGKPPLST